MLYLRKLLPLYAVIFLGFFGYALTITMFVPMLLDTHFLLLPTATSTELREVLSGALLAMYPLGQFLGCPVIGRFSDYFGRKKVLSISLAACIIGFAGMALSIQLHQLIWLFIFAFFTGLCESNMAISQSVIADLHADSAQETRLMGYAYSACSLGYIIGPIVGGTSGAALSYSTPFWITAAGVVLLIAWIIGFFRDDYTINRSVSLNVASAIISFRTIFSNIKLRKIYFVNFLIFFSSLGLYRVVSIYVMDRWHPSLHIYALLISFVSFLCLLANLFLINPLTKRFRTRGLLTSLLVIGGVLTLLIMVPNQFNWIWLTFGATVIPTVMALPTCTTWLSQQANEKEQGQVLGNNQALLVLGESTSAAIGGALAAALLPLPVALMGVILLFSALMAWKLG